MLTNFPPCRPCQRQPTTTNWRSKMFTRPMTERKSSMKLLTFVKSLRIESTISSLLPDNLEYLFVVPMIRKIPSFLRISHTWNRRPRGEHWDIIEAIDLIVSLMLQELEMHFVRVSLLACWRTNPSRFACRWDLQQQGKPLCPNKLFRLTFSMRIIPAGLRQHCSIVLYDYNNRLGW